MIPVKSVQLGVRWSNCDAVASSLQITLGQGEHETTVDGMLRGNGHTLMRAEQLAHLAMGMAPCASASPMRLKNAEEMLASDRLVLTSLLGLFGYQVELC